MNKELKFFVASTNGLRVFKKTGQKISEQGFFFEGRSPEFIAGCRERSEIVFVAVAFDGGYRTDDGGKTWLKVLEGDFRTFSVDPHDERVIYAGAGPIRLFRSEDMGLTWEPIDSLLSLPDTVQSQWTVPMTYRGKIPPHICTVFVHPNNDNRIFLALEHGGIIYSNDRGANWADATKGIDYPDMHVIRNLPNSADSFCVSSARGFFRSDDINGIWTRSENGMPWAYTEEYSYSHDWLFCPGDTPRIVLAGARGSPGVWAREQTTPLGHILLSDDLGQSWRRSTFTAEDLPMNAWTLLHHPETEKVLFAGMGDGARGFGFDPKKEGKGSIYRSDDRGETWQAILTDLPTVQTLWVTNC
ncbi:MAG: hypothetical protein VW557_12565 [Rhodospirillaceae bacterium]